MPKVFLGLGSNLGNRKEQLERALREISMLPHRGKMRCSPCYETKAMVPLQAPSHWNIPFLNMACELETNLDPEDLLDQLKLIEKKMGRVQTDRWAPRIVDIDVLLYDDREIQTPDLIVPHPGIRNRSFFLDPLKDLCASLTIPGDTSGESVLRRARQHPEHQPAWMAILNATPDSFSDGGQLDTLNDLNTVLDEVDRCMVQIVDIGAESTRPGASPLDANDEWKRLEPFLKEILNRYRNRFPRPWISVDTRHPRTAESAIELGVDVINDVSGGNDLRMLDLIRQSECQYVVMHSLSIPADKKIVVDENCDPVEMVKDWMFQKIDQLGELGISPDRVIVDPGIGFGKTTPQSLELLRRMDRFLDAPCRVLVGHSRKSFMQAFSKESPEDRDWETVGASLGLAQKGIDILRVHNFEAHVKAIRASRTIA